MATRLVSSLVLVGLAALLASCQGLVRGVSQLSVTVSGGGTGTVTSTPAGINCSSQPSSGTCQATFQGVRSVTLTAAPATGFGFGGWTGCQSTSGATCAVSGPSSVDANFTADLKSINHIIFLAQENRSFDSYFGAMRRYWSQNGFPDQAFDGLPQFNPSPGAAPTNPGCDRATSTTNVCVADNGSSQTPSFHFNTMCVENPSPSWNEAHVSWNVQNPVGPPPPTLDGFVEAGANDARQSVPPLLDVAGQRVMGYYDGGDLNYYYFMASSFATSDRWFAPLMSRTSPNRQYLIGATSHGYVYPVGSNANDGALVSSPPIYESLASAGVSWKIYVNPAGTSCASNPTSQCLFQFTYVKDFAWGQTIQNTPSLLQNIVPISQFTSDVQNGTLPQVAQIEPASDSGLDEHPADSDVNPPCCSVQAGANYVAGLINSLMTSSSWKDSIFILTFDEWGGFYDHVAPQPAVNPDGRSPVDFFPGDTCTGAVGPNCDFVFTGYRVPFIVISPYTKKNFVSHSVADNTAILKLIESRFNIPALTARDKAQIDMSTEFLDFKNVPWKTPPSPPKQNQGGACYLDHLP